MLNLQLLRHAALALLATLTLVGIDVFWNTGPNAEDMYRLGQARYLMLASAVLMGWQLAAANPIWALFWCYSAVLWVVGDWPWWGMMDLAMIGGCLIVGDAIRCFFRARAVLTWFARLAGLQALYVLLQRAGLDPFLASTYTGRFHNEAIGTLGHFTHVGAFVGLGAVVFFGRGLREPKNLAGFALCLAGVAACHSTMAILGTAAGLWYVLARSSVAAGVATAGAGVAGLGAWWWIRPGAEFFGFSGREVVWPYVVKAWLDGNVLFGNGPGYWAGALPTFNIQGVGNDRWYQAHNDPLQVLPEQGLLGLAIVLVGVFFLFRFAQRMHPAIGGMLTALCVGCLGNFLFHVPAFGLIGAWLACEIHHHELRSPAWKKL